MLLFACVDHQRLAHVSREDALGMIAQRGAEIAAKHFDSPRHQDYDLWCEVGRALSDLQAGERPRSPMNQAPRWLHRVVRARVSDASEVLFGDPEFWIIRSLERLGVVALEPDREYVLAFVSSASSTWRDVPATSVAHALRDDPELIERAFWPMFTTEGGGQVSLQNVDRFKPRAAWREVVIELVSDGTVDRNRVLTACLDALNSDLGAYQAGWFARAFAALTPTPEEVTHHQSTLLAILRSRVPASVTFAIDQLRSLDKTGLLDDESAASELATGLGTRGKATAVKIVRMLSAIAARREDLAPAVCETVLRGLEHPEADVQARTLDLLEQFGALDAARGIEVHPTLAGRLQQDSSECDVAMLPSTPWEPPTLVLPAPVARRDLVERTAALIEDASDPLELERVLAALATLDDPAVLTPLAKRAQAVETRDERDSLNAAFARLVLMAHGGPRPRASDDRTADPTAFYRRRLAEVGAVLCGDAPPAPLLATPTDGPWIAPGVLVERLLKARASGAPARASDVVAALLRLHPDGRDDALSTWNRARDGRLGPVVAHALGAPAPDPKVLGGAGKDETALWVAASRARDPFARDVTLIAAGNNGAGRSAPIEATVVATTAKSSYGYTVSSFSIEVAEGATVLSAAEPTAARGVRSDVCYGTLWDWPTWIATAYPHDAEQFLVDSIDAVLTATHVTPANMPDVGYVLDSLLTHPGRTGRLSAATIAAGLAAVQQADRVRAADCCAALVATGRIPVETFVDALATIAPTIALQRWSHSLGDAAEAAPGARDVVIDVLVRLLPRLDRSQRGLSGLLDRLFEEAARAGRLTITDPEFAAWASSFTGSSKSARTARRLLVR